ncbi:MAG: AtaL-like protein [Pseudomonadota bacterium]
MKLLEFQHIIQINDPDQPHIPPLSRQQLWDGLLFRARYPGHFNPAINSRLENISSAGFVRYLQFGEMELRDEVLLVPGQEIHTSTAGTDQPLFAESITRIEEPAPERLFVRFMYRRDSGNESGGLNVDDYLKAAYVQNDRDAVRLLRELTASGALTGLADTGLWLQ